MQSTSPTPPGQFKSITTGIVKWQKELDNFALFPQWYTRSSFGLTKEEHAAYTDRVAGAEGKEEEQEEEEEEEGGEEEDDYEEDEEEEEREERVDDS
jgi:hypothetical protein